jgi:hypothetical protein
MSIQDWRTLLKAMSVRGKLHPATAEELDQYETKSGFRLPSSYRDFCRVFGPGQIGGWYQLAVPHLEKKGKKKLYDLAGKTKFYHDGLEWEEYAPDPKRFQRSVIFGDDNTGAVYYWDPEEITVPKKSEYAIYAMFRDFTGEKLCDTFWDFVGICLHRHRKKLYDEPPKMEYLAM